MSKPILTTEFMGKTIEVSLPPEKEEVLLRYLRENEATLVDGDGFVLCLTCGKGGGECRGDCEEEDEEDEEDRCGFCDSKSEPAIFPSGGKLTACKDCYLRLCRPREEDESWEDYTTRHPHMTGEEKEGDDLDAFWEFVGNVTLDEGVELAKKAFHIRTCGLFNIAEQRALIDALLRV